MMLGFQPKESAKEIAWRIRNSVPPKRPMVIREIERPTDPDKEKFL